MTRGSPSSSAKRIAYNGVHLFEVSNKPVPPATITSPVRLYLRGEIARCADGTHAVYRLRQEKVAIAQEGVAPRELPSHFGYVADDAGNATHWFAPSGLLFTVTYLGRLGEEGATAPFRMPDRV